MKFIRYIKQTIFILLAMVLPIVGCDTDTLHNLNVNPNALNKMNMNFLFTAAELSTSCNGAAGDTWYVNWRTNINVCAFAMQHLASTGTGAEAGDKYFDYLEGNNATWEFTYGDQLKNLAEVIKQTSTGGFEEGRRKNTREAARILRVFNFHRLTDMYGNIPYSEANQGITGVFRPKYDKQSDIYTDLLKELDEASAAISTANPDDGFKSSDMIYQGDVAKWKKWGYSLMLRLAMRISNVDAAKAATYVTKAVAGGVFSSNSDNPYILHSNANGNSRNGFSRAFIEGGASSVLSKTLVDKLMGTNPASAADDDPRLLVISGGINGNVNPLLQRGMPNGLDNATLDTYTGVTSTNINATFSKMNPKFTQIDEAFMFMNYAEVEFLQAEAIERTIGTVGGTAQSHYDAGVKGAMQMYTLYDATLTVPDAAVATYLTTYPYAGTTAQKIDMIGTQLWISKFMNWWDAWADYRRSNSPVLVPVNYLGNVTGGLIPTKLRLHSTEAAVNADNVAAGATTPDSWVGKVWWDGGN
jgi:Starch-binding associating with outer membrane